MVKLICIDVDGTLVDDNKKILEITKRSIIRAQEMGIKICIASGRPDFGVNKYIKELDLIKYGGYLISYNGGKLKDLKDGKILFEKNINRDLVREVLQYVKGTELDLFLYGDNILYTTGENSYSFEYSKKAAEDKISIVKDLHDSFYEDTPKVLLAQRNDIIMKYKKEIDDRFNKYLHHTFSDDFYYELMPKGINKGATIKILMDYLNLESKDIMAFGDGANDLEMIRLSGIGVAMGNGNPILKKEATYICKTNNEDGLGIFLEDYLLKKLEN